MKLISFFLGVIFAITSIALKGQVPTVVLNGTDIKEFIPFHNGKSPSPNILPDVDVQAALDEDAAAGIEIPRFGVKIPVSISKKNGEIEEHGDFVVWKVSFFAEKAKSLNLEFAKVFLPEEAEMYVYNNEESMFVGPINQTHIYDGQYSTDIIRGNSITIEVRVRKRSYEAFSLEVTNVIHGFMTETHERDYGDSQACNVDVNCFSGNVTNEKDAVCMVITDNAKYCSGVLVNNACQDLRSFLLTAFHCLDGESGFLNWTFRFNYDSPCNGGEPSTWLTYSGANYRAAWAATDFALLELTGSIVGQKNLALAGWNRATIPPTQVVRTIHHPKGDVKKISVDNEPLITTDPNKWKVGSWDTGMTEPGSSGGPLLDASSRIIGQLHQGIDNPQCNGEGSGTVNDEFGRFSVSWTGGGSTALRLSSWLGGASAPTTTNTIRSPWVNTNNNIFVCSSANRQFTLVNPIPGRSITWSVNNQQLFATTGGAARTGTGTTATLRAASVSSSGPATLTFTLNQAGCTTVILTTQIWVGRPSMPSTNPPGNPTIELGLGSSINVVLDAPPYSSSSNAIWSAAGSLQLNGSSPSYQMNFNAVNTGLGTFSATTTNTCGTSPAYIGNVNVTNGPPVGNKGVTNTPSPTKTSFVCEIPEEYVIPNQANTLLIYSSQGKFVSQEEFVGQKKVIQIQNWQPDVYFTLVKTPIGAIWGKVMVIK